MQHLFHLITKTTPIFIYLRLTKQFSNILNTLRLLLVFAHHAQRRSEELLAVLNLSFQHPLV
jgi:hypothetical protein